MPCCCTPIGRHPNSALLTSRRTDFFPNGSNAPHAANVKSASLRKAPRRLEVRWYGVGALGQSVPITSQVTALYHINSSYAQFLLSALLPAVWQILVVLYGLNALARTDRLGLDWTTRGVWFGLWRTLLPHVLIGWGWGLAWSLLLSKGLGYPMQGSWLVLRLGLGLASAACVSMGAFFYGIIRDPARALSLAGAYTAPGFAFMGVTFPVSAMDTENPPCRALSWLSNPAPPAPARA